MLQINDARTGRFVLDYLCKNYQQVNWIVDFDTYKGWKVSAINNHINSEIDKLDLRDSSILEYELTNHINNQLIDINSFNWIDINNTRQCNYLSIFTTVCISQFSTRTQSFELTNVDPKSAYRPPNDPLPLEMQDRYQSIIDFVDYFIIRDDIPGERRQNSYIHHRTRIVENLQKQWQEIEPLSKLYDSFFEQDDYYEQRMEWAWSYVKKNEWNHPIIQPNATDSHEDLVKATFDMYPDSFGAVENLFKKMRNAWYQKKSKSGNTERKNYSISMSVEKMTKLDEIKAFHGKSRTFVLENLIDRAHKKMLKDQKETDLLGDDDD